MKCINRHLIEKLSRLFTVYEISHIVDPKNKLENQIYYFKLNQLLSSNADIEFVRCKRCLKVLLWNKFNETVCDYGIVVMNSEGDIFSRHELDLSFDVHEFLLNLYLESKESWKSVF